MFLLNLIKNKFLKYIENFFWKINIYKMGGGLMQLVAYGAQDVYLK